MTWNDRNRGDQFSEELLEAENDSHFDRVASKVATLKHIAIDLKSEAKDQVTVLGNAGGLFETATSLLGNSFQRVQGMRRTRGANCKYMCYFSAFLVAFILLVYLLIGNVIWR